MVFLMAYACRMSSNITSQKSKPRIGRRPMAEGTAIKENTTITTSKRFREAWIAISERENCSMAAVAVASMREKYPKDFKDL